MRSKAHWGYDADFLAKCREELIVTPEHLAQRFCLLSEDENLLGYVETSNDGGEYCLEKLFVEPEAMGRGVGRALLAAAVSHGKTVQARELVIEADPGALPFYKKFGALDAGQVPSGSIPGRYLPRLVIPLEN